MRALEERGIGRPSTYASIIGTILDRGYVFKKGTALVPTFLAFAVTRLLEQHFGRLVDYDFTARMEDDLDRIAAGDEERVDWLRALLLRRRRRPGPARARHRASRRDRRARGQLDRDPATATIVVRVGRYGPYLERGERARQRARRTSPPTSSRSRRPRSCSPRRPATARSARTPRRAARSSSRRPLRPVRHRGAAGGRDREAAHGVALPDDVAGDGHARRGACACSRCRASLERGRRRGDPRRRTAATGRTSRRAARPRSLESRGAAVHDHARGGARAARPAEAAPRPRRAEAAAARARPRSGERQARRAQGGPFRPYVTDGETNASLRRGDDPETVSIERAAELLAERRSKGPAPKRKRGGTARRR